MSGGIGQALLRSLERHVFVSPSLRNLIEALPTCPQPGDGQAEAVAGAIVFNVWMCCGERSLSVLAELDELTERAFALFPVDVHQSLQDAAAIAPARAAAVRLATRLGFSPGHRTRVAIAVEEVLVDLVQHAGRCRLHLAVEASGAHRGFRFYAVGERTARARPGRVPCLIDLERLRQVAEDASLGETPDGLPVVTTRFLSTPPQRKRSSGSSRRQTRTRRGSRRTAS